jgi:HNH endonuclease
MTVPAENLERLYQDFVSFLKAKGEDFKNFATSPFIDKDENYKYAVSEQAKESLGQQWWKQTDIGTGKIQEKVKEAIKTKLIYKYQYHNNNLVDWRKRDDFAKLPKSVNLETILFNFFKNKAKDSEVFEEFLKLGLSYQLIAYLYFIKDKNRYLPITQERFDEIFQLIGIPEFKTSGRASWDNYNEFIDIVKQTREFLKTKDPNVSLLDAHSFLYVLGSQMKVEKFAFSSLVDTVIEQSPLENNAEIKVDQEPSLAVDNTFIEEEKLFNDEILAEEIPADITEQLFEGAKKSIVINAYERNPKARKLCIEHWKAICAVCEFDFEKNYGEIGKGFIHVHHLTPVSKIGEQYEVDPINDLRPVCPNCHSMLHRQDDTLSIDQLKLIVAVHRQALPAANIGIAASGAGR